VRCQRCGGTGIKPHNIIALGRITMYLSNQSLLVIIVVGIVAG
jgi:hypothetical protein